MATALNAQVTGRDDLTDARYRIATTEGSRRVKGWVFGDFGLHPDRHHRRIVLDHLPTGGKVSDHGSLADALDAMAAMTKRRQDDEIETAISEREVEWTEKGSAS